MHSRLGSVKPEGNRRLDIDVKERKKIKMDPIERGCEDMNWIHMAQDTDQWQALVNTVMNIHVS
jgi:hypothetical protein